MNEKLSREQQPAEASSSTGQCARAAELVSYLYHEASPAEAQEFEAHMERCASCRLETIEFVQVRRSIGDWRTEALGGVTSSALDAAAAHSFVPINGPIKESAARQRSALAAIREFFMLSPGWMRAATAFAGLAFCVLALVAFTHLSESTPHMPAVASEKSPAEKIYSKQEVDQMLARVKLDNEASRQPQALDQKQVKTMVATVDAPTQHGPARQPPRRIAAAPSPSLANYSPVRHGSSNMSPRERQQLAEVLLPQESRDEEKLPRLSDLLDNDSN